jgi:hypothetical protein
MSIELAERQLAALEREITVLDQRIGEARGRATKLRHYIEVATEFAGEPQSTNVAAITSPAVLNGEAKAWRPRVPQGGMSGRAINESIAVLRERGHPIRTNDLLKIIEDRGVRLGGAKPANALSGYLSRAPGLTADRTLGWSLEEWRQFESQPAHNMPEGRIVNDDASDEYEESSAPNSDNNHQLTFQE